jgi:hypothetical protein
MFLVCARQSKGPVIVFYQLSGDSAEYNIEGRLQYSMMLSVAASLERLF